MKSKSVPSTTVADESVQPEELQQLLARASDYLTQRKIGEAETLLEQAVKRAPDSLELRITIAFLCLQSGNQVTAELHLRAAHRIKPDNTDVLHNLAVLATSLGKFEEAKQYFHKLLVIDEKNVDVYNDLAVIEAESGNDAAAESAFAAGIKLPGTNKKIVRNYLEFCSQRGNKAGFERAASLYRNRWHTEPDVEWQPGSSKAGTTQSDTSRNITGAMQDKR